MLIRCDGPWSPAEHGSVGAELRLGGLDRGQRVQLGDFTKAGFWRSRSALQDNQDMRLYLRLVLLALLLPGCEAL